MNSPDKTTPTIGKLLTGVEGRDAIHFALAPVMVVGDEIMQPGERARLVPGTVNQVWGMENGAGSLNEGEDVGIIDPFLEAPVLPKQQCWLFLYPNSITSLRHIWTHPAFVPTVPGSKKAVLKHVGVFKDEVGGIGE